MLEARRLSYRYDNGPWLLRHLSFRIRPGEVVGLPGPSGRGKTTLGRLLAGYLAPQEGAVTLDDSPLPTGVRCPVQMLFQHPELAMNPRWKAGDIIAEGNPDAGELLDELCISPAWLSRYPHELSGGELQRLAVARAMAPGTRYLVADEMTASLDPNTQALIWGVVLGWARRNDVGILAISHDRALLGRIAHRIDETFAEHGDTHGQGRDFGFPARSCDAGPTTGGPAGFAPPSDA